MTVITRKALEHWGRKPPHDLAYVTIVAPGASHVIVTWADVMKARRERQSRRLAVIRQIDHARAYKLWVAYFDQELMGGWHAFLEDLRGDPFRHWIRYEGCLTTQLMGLFPLSCDANWYRWKEAFANQFECRRHDNRPVGVRYLWWDGRGIPRLAERQPC